jgi:hypothetical protein
VARQQRELVNTAPCGGAGEVEQSQQCSGGGYFVALRIDGDLAEDGAGAVVERGDQVRRLTVGAGARAQSATLAELLSTSTLEPIAQQLISPITEIWSTRERGGNAA